MEVYKMNLWRFFERKSSGKLPGKCGNEVPMSDRFDLFWMIFAGLEFLHQNNLKHLDIKLSNVLIKTNSGDFDRQNCVITDFGIGGQKDKETGMAGTPGFASPEQLLRSNVGMKSDLYSLGRLLVFLLAEWPSAWTILYKPIEDISKVNLNITNRDCLGIIGKLLKVRLRNYYLTCCTRFRTKFRTSRIFPPIYLCI